MSDSFYFEVITPLDRKVRITIAYWELLITLKHPIMRGKEALVQRALQSPVEIRQSKTDPDVYLHYGTEPPYLICVVARYLNGDGFIITTYRTNKIKEGTPLWKP